MASVFPSFVPSPDPLPSGLKDWWSGGGDAINFQRAMLPAGRRRALRHFLTRSFGKNLCRDVIFTLFSMPPAIISPSVLASDFGQLTAECKRMIIGGAQWLHMGKLTTLWMTLFLINN